MTRHTFGGSPTDWTFTIGAGNVAVLAASAVLTFWNQPVGGVQYTDLLDKAGNPATSITAEDGEGDYAPGTVRQFSGPDTGVTAMWADTGSEEFPGRLLMLATDLGDLAARVATLEAAVAAQQTMLAYALYGIKYDAGVGAYPPIPPEIAGQQYVIFIGPPTPTAARPKDLHFDTIE